jgi:hypothetical protein
MLSKKIKIMVYRSIIFPVVLYGRETWSFTLMEEHRLNMFKNRVLRNAFGLQRDEVPRQWRGLHKEKLNDLYSLPNIIQGIKKNDTGGHVTHMGDRKGAYRFLVGRPEGKIPLGRSRCSGRIIIKWTFKRWDSEALIGLIWLKIGTGGGRL